MNDGRGRPPTTVAQVHGMSEASLAVCMLAGHGIAGRAESWHTATTAWHWSHALDGVRLRVPAEHAQAARELLAGMQGPPRARRWQLVLFFLLAFWWAGLPPPPRGLRIVPPARPEPTLHAKA